MQHSTKKLSEVCTHKQNTKISNVRNTLKKDKQKVSTDRVPYTDMASTQQNKRKFLKTEYMRDYIRKKCQMQHSSKTSKVCTQEHKQSGPVIRNKNDDTAMPQKTKRMQCDYKKEYMEKEDKIPNTI